MQHEAALRTEAVILFERYEQKDNSGWPDPAFSRGNAQIKNFKRFTT
jgi:hypothetical protein